MRFRPSSSTVTVVLLAAAIGLLAGAMVVRAGRTVLMERQSERERLGRSLLESVERAVTVRESLRATTSRDTHALEEVWRATLDEVRAAALRLDDPALAALSYSLDPQSRPTDREADDALMRIGALAGRTTLDATIAAVRETRRIAEIETQSMLLAAVGLLALALVAAARMVRERRRLERALPPGRDGEGLSSRVERLAGRALHAFRQQIDLVGERVELARVLREHELQEEALQYEVRQNRDRIEKLEIAQMNDELTGVLNFKYFLLRLGEALDEFIATSREFCLLALDLDDFKGINDGYGHHVGDAALKEFAQLLAGSVRDGDVVFRKSGDEFYVLMPGAAPEHGEALAERLLAETAGHEVAYDSAGEQYSVALGTSIGVLHCAQVDRHLLGTLTRDQRLSETYGFADAALFKAKFSGKGCARIYRTGLTVRSVNPAEYPPELDQLHREVRSRYPLLPDDVKAVFNDNINACRTLLNPGKRLRRSSGDGARP